MEVYLAQTFAVAGIYYIWLSYRLVQEKRMQQLRERLAFMLWNAAKYAN